MHNSAAWLETATFEEASDDEIVNAITSGAAGMVLMVKHFLPLLRESSSPDIFNIVSSSAQSNSVSCEGHEAFYALKSSQGELLRYFRIVYAMKGFA